MSNQTTTTVTVQKALSNASFRDGFRDYATRNGWHEKWGRVEQWNYERGRMFAAWLETQKVNLASYPLKKGRWATRTAISDYATARKQGSLF